MSELSVLVVEDEPSFAHALTVGLGREGFAVTVASDGADALRRFEEVKPDLVLLDVMLPTMSGIDVCRAIRATSRVTLPLKEFDLLGLLLENAGRVLTREVLIDRVWGSDYVGDTKTLDVHIKRLRSKVEVDPKNPELIVTIRGLGYKFDDAASG